MLRIATVKDHERMSTQQLLQIIGEAVENGETEFQILASGQHDIGGPLWNRDGKTLRFSVSNPGQRLGSMCLPGTQITVSGPAPADVGWLNSGGIITVCGDAGETAGHCAADGKIYIGGRAGARTGSLMKHDPELNPPELWILNSVGSFSFEFMSGGFAVVCGHNSQVLPSVLGDRPCVGMVGGVIYFRGPHTDLPDDVKKLPLDENDILWLQKGLPDFLQAIGKPGMLAELSIWKHWAKLVPTGEKKDKPVEGLARFRAEEWFESGLFGDVYPDDKEVSPLVPKGMNRLSRPERFDADKCTDCRKCLKNCPQAAILRRKSENPAISALYSVNGSRCIGCGICAAVCPEKLWEMTRTQEL